MNIVDHAATVLKMFDIEPKPLDILLNRYLREHREINSKNRRAIADTVFGIMRWKRRIDGLLKLAGINKPTNLQRVQELENSLPFEVVAEAKQKIVIPAEAGIQSILKRTGSPIKPFGDDNLNSTMPNNFPGGIAAWVSFPDFLYEKLVTQYGADGAYKMAIELNQPASPCLRVNILKTSREEAIKIFIDQGIDVEPSINSPFGIYLNHRVDLNSFDLYRRGMIEVQDEASQLAVLAANPQPGETVLDACAGAGGKSLMMAMLMKGKGRVIATDTDKTKLNELKRRAARAGAKNIEIISQKELKKEETKFRGNLDLVFIDAPCSSIGTLRRSPDLKWRISEKDIEEYSKIQFELLEHFAEWVQPGGKLVYATCSILRDENEDVVEKFLARKKFQLFNMREQFFADPRKGEWNGFFAVVMKHN